MTTRPFEMVPLPEGRSTGKPRDTGLTMMMDWGIPMQQLRDRLDLVAPYVDLGKIVAGTARLYEAETFRSKLELYKSYDVKPFLGGQFLEYVFATQGWDAVVPYCEEAKRHGIEAIEVSDNCVPLNDQERHRMIRIAIDAGLEVHGEVGSKTMKQQGDELIAQASLCIEAGCDLVLVEAAELMENGSIKRELLSQLCDGLDIQKVLFELSGYWIKGTTVNDVFELQKAFVLEFGPDVNIANVQPDAVIGLEALRCGLNVVGPDRTDQAAE
ncbi:MAG: phosphosulfolactate synthase [Pseudomonadota bacterium]